MAHNSTPTTFPIGAVERDTGLAKDTLRVWERRYGFPQPLRDAHGERQYPAAQVARLRVIKRLTDKGHRPGKLLAMDDAELDALTRRAFEGGAPWSRGAHPGELAAYLEDCRMHRVESLRAVLLESMGRLGLGRFVLEIAAPLVTAVGDCWERGQFQVYEEHLFTEVMQNVLRSGIAGIARPAHGGPTVLLTTFPQERHGLGLLMAEAMFALAGAHCIALGTGLPVPDIARAAAQADVVALSFSISLHGAQVQGGLAELGAMLPPQVELWCGGTAPGLARCPLPSFRYVELSSAAAQVAAWRAARPDRSGHPATEHA